MRSDIGKHLSLWFQFSSILLAARMTFSRDFYLLIFFFTFLDLNNVAQQNVSILTFQYA